MPIALGFTQGHQIATQANQIKHHLPCIVRTFSDTFCVMTLTVRLDEQTELELSELVNAGKNRNAVIREAIHLAHQTLIKQRLREESMRLLEDEQDLAEMKLISEQMGELRAW